MPIIQIFGSQVINLIPALIFNPDLSKITSFKKAKNDITKLCSVKCVVRSISGILSFVKDEQISKPSSNYYFLANVNDIDCINFLLLLF